jgi:hypothetical protein
MSNEADKIFRTAKAMWGIGDTIDRLRGLAREVDPSADPLISPRDAAALLVDQGWSERDFVRRFS